MDLINRDRAVYGLRPVVLGDNPAAQAHAEDMREWGCLSHWGSNGLKPYMRYTLAGGIKYRGRTEHWHGIIDLGIVKETEGSGEARRLKGSAQELEVRRRLAGRLLLQGKGIRQVARLVGASPAAVHHWKRLMDREGLRARPHPGPRPRLTEG